MSKYQMIDSHKMQYHLEAVAKWKAGDGRGVYPIYVEISPVGHCNHRCTFCAVDYIGYVNRKMDTGVLCAAIEDMASAGIRSVMFAGEGEPMLHPSISLLVDCAYRCGLDVAFTTNGTAMTPAFVDASLSKITWIKISLNAGDEETYAHIHRTSKSHFELVWRNISYAVAKKRIQGSNTTLGVQSVLLPENAHTMDALALRCRAEGVDYLVIKPYSHNPNSHTQTYAGIHYGADYTELLSSLASYANSKFEIVTRTASMEAWDSNDRGYTTCHSTPYFWAYLMATGDVYACSAHIGNADFNLGNINTASFQEIWMGDKRRDLIGKMMNGFDISTCRKNCRMDKVNRFLWDVKNPGEHRNFI